MATYKRLDLLPKVLGAYTSGQLPSLHAIVVVWQDTSTNPPEWLTQPDAQRAVPVYVRVSKQNSMNERFRMDSRVQTQALFMVDDDLVIQHSDLEWGFSVWKQMGRAERIIGFAGRDYVFENGAYTFVVMPRMTYSMILSNAAFLDRTFFELYWDQKVEPFRQHVDKGTSHRDLLVWFS